MSSLGDPFFGTPAGHMGAKPQPPPAITPADAAPASSALQEAADRERKALEAQWIGLLSWLARQINLTEDEVVERADPKLYLSAKAKLAQGSTGLTAPSWTVLSFLDLADFFKVSTHYDADLRRLGNPPANWKAIIEGQLAAGLVRYRNHLSHANRFVELPAREQEKARELLHSQRQWLAQWWPAAHPQAGRILAGESPFRPAITQLGADAASAANLVSALGFRFLPNAPNLVPRAVNTPMAQELAPYVAALHRVGECALADGNSVGFYVAYLSEWKLRSSERDRERRKVARAVVTHQVQDPRRLILLMDSSGQSKEAELILPRQSAGGGFSTVRAALDLREPNRYHVDLLEALTLSGRPSLPDVTRRWNEAFNVERVTKRFYEEFRALRDRIIEELLANNTENPALRGHDRKTDRDFDLQLHAFATRLLGRLLFLWFLQQKRWLGSSPGDGDTDFLVSAFQQRGDKDYFNGVLVPLFFDGLGRRRTDPRHLAVQVELGALPYLGGGLFRPNADEFESALLGMTEDGVPTLTVNLPDALFDPTQDNVETRLGRTRTRTRSILGLLRSYRFTTQESTPDDQSVDPDPELLGKVFENLYQQTERHQTGAYYTPREIVHYMCRETLDGYLEEKAGVRRDRIHQLRKAAIEWEGEGLWLDSEEAARIAGALEDVRILDPAVGSGAFLLASMQEIILLRRGIELAELGQRVGAGSQDVAEWKRHIATNSLFGVDINPTAVEICHLRLWLSMLVDLDVSNFADIPPLPNLDFRVVAGDSLIDRMGAKPFADSWPRPEGVQTHGDTYLAIDRLKGNIRRNTRRFEDEGASRGEVRRLTGLRQLIRRDRSALVSLELDQELTLSRDRLGRLERAARPMQSQIRKARDELAYLGRLKAGLTSSSEKPFLWPVHFAEILTDDGSGGFDIVLANPPYVRMEGLDNKDEEAYGYAFPQVAAGRADILVYFYARAVQVLRQGGHVAFITSNSFVKRSFGAAVKRFLGSSLILRRVIDFGETKVFDATVEPYILIGSKGDPDDEHQMEGHFLFVEIARRAGRRGSVLAVREQLADLDGLLDSDRVSFTQKFFTTNDWKIESPEVVALFRRLVAKGTPLGEYVKGRIYMGIKTGLNEAFVIDEAKRLELINNDPRCAEVIKPWLRGRDVKRWKPEWAGLYVIFTRRGTNLAQFPAIEAHLSQYRTGLLKRATSHSHPWYELQQPQEGIWPEFERPKVIWPSISRSIRFAFDRKGFYSNDKTNIWAGAPSWPICVFNSTIGRFLFYQLTKSIPGSFMELKQQYIAPFPIVEPVGQEAAELELVAETGDDSALERIDVLVGQLYGLDDLAVGLIRRWLARKSVSGALIDDSEPEDEDD